MTTDDTDHAQRLEIVTRHSSAKLTMWRGVVSLASIPLVIVALFAVAALGAIIVDRDADHVRARAATS